MSTRQSSRLKEKPKTDLEDSPYVVSSDDESDVPLAAVSSASTKTGKRKRKGATASTTKSGGATGASASTLVGKKDDSGRPTKKLRGKRGFLQQIAEMPLELLFEIFGKLDPIDVLNLARTSKSLRATLMRKSSADIWKAALENIPDLPPIPEDISQPQWVDLLFGKNCYICGKTTSLNTQVYAWEARIRGCSKCIHGQFTPSPYSQFISALLPTISIQGSGRRSQYRFTTQFYNKNARKLTDTYDGFSTAEEKKEWFDARLAERKAIVSHAVLCVKWLEELREARVNELEELRQQRRAALRQRVEGMGYHPTVVGLTFNDHEFWSAPCVVSTLRKDITDRVWAVVEDSFVRLMDGFKIAYAKELRAQSVRKRVDLLVAAHQEYVESRPMDEPILTVGDLFQAPGVRDVLLAEPIDDELDPNAVKDLIISKVPEYQEEWLKAAKGKLVELIRPRAVELGLDKDTVDHSTLDLALALFECKHCRKDLMHFMACLHHSCARTGRADYGVYPMPEGADDDLQTLITHAKQVPWIGCFVVGQRAERTIVVIKKLGLDPATLTTKALDELDPIFEWVDTGALGRSMYSWRGLAEKWGQLDPTCFSVLDEQTSVMVREMLDDAMRKARADMYARTIYCAHCRKYTGNSREVRKHLKDTHGVEVVTNEDVWIHPDNMSSGRHAVTYYKYPGATVI